MDEFIHVAFMCLLAASVGWNGGVIYKYVRRYVASPSIFTGHDFRCMSISIGTPLVAIMALVFEWFRGD